MKLIGAGILLFASFAGSSPAQGTAPAAGTAAAGMYRGTTSQGYVLTFRVLRGGRSLSPFATSIRVRCDGVPTQRTFLPPGTTIFDGRSFRRRASDGKGGVYTFGGVFTRASTARGTISLGSTRIVFGGIELCVTVGTVTWTARRVGP